jgi:hypothetical protein
MKLLVAAISIFIFSIAIKSAPIANAGPDRTVFTNVVISLDGSSSSGYVEGMQIIAGSQDKNTIMWTFGYNNWTYSGSVIAPIAYPETGNFTATLTVCDSTSCSSDSTLITVQNIPQGIEVVMTDTGNPVTNQINLQSEIDNSVSINNKVITLPITWRSTGATLILKHRTVANYLIIRTANFASLPNSRSRVSPSDASNMPKLEIDANIPIIDTPSPSSTPPRYYMFLGIHFRKTVASFNMNANTMVNIGQDGITSLNQLPNNILFDRCFFDGGSDTSDTLRGILLRASDSGVVNSYFQRYKGDGLETQAILTLMGFRQAIMNNFLESGAENYLSGGADPSIPNHVPTDIVFRRNYLKKPLIWNPSDPAYLGANMVIKNLFELKLGDRYSVQGNRFDTHWIEDQPGYAIVFTVRNQSGTAPWSVVSHIDFTYNQVHKISRGIDIFGSDNIQPSQQANRFFIANNTFTGLGYQEPLMNLSIFTDGPSAGIDRLWFIKNSSDGNGDVDNGWGRSIMFENTTKNTNLVVNGNIMQGYFSHDLGTGTFAFQTATGGSYQAIKNCLYRPSGTNPSNNSSLAAITDVKYINLAGFDLTLASDSPCFNTGIDNGRAGADISGINAMNAHIIDGIWPSGTSVISKCNWNTASICN